MKTFWGVTFWGMAIMWQFSAILYFASIWGVLGFFGAIFTMPVSGLVYILLSILIDPLTSILWIGFLIFSALKLGQEITKETYELAKDSQNRRWL